MRLEQGEVVAGYRIDGVLGEGGMGVVYEATQLSLERKVALKLISAALGDDFSFRERFRREGLIQAAIDHPNIVTVYEAGETERGLFLAMRLIRGPSLRDLIVARELDAERALRFLGQVGDALDTAHEAGLIHRDIKPSNVLVSTGARDHAYLADFGVTKAAGEASLTRTGQLVGTIDYMAPEVIRGEPATRASDIYALGALVYECLTGSIPFPRESDAAVLYAHLFDAPPRVTQERPDLPAAIDAVIDRSMAKEPAERYESAGGLVVGAEAALGAVATELGTPAAIRDPEQLGVRRPEEAVPTPVGVTRPAVPETRQADGAPATAPAPPPALTPVAAAAPVPPTVSAEAPAVQPSRALALWAGVAALVAVLAAGGFVAGRAGGGGGTQAAASKAVTAGGLALSVPTAWRTTAKDVDVKPLELHDAVRLDAPGRDSGRLLVGRYEPFPPPAESPRYPRVEVVSLGDVQAYRFRAFRFGPERADLYDIVHDGGARVVRVACVRPPGDRATARLCDRIAATARPVGIKPVLLTPSRKYALALDAALDVLAERRNALERLRTAKTPGVQATAAEELRQLHAAAARAIARAAAPPIASVADRELVAALRSAAGAYDRLASGALSRNESSYEQGRKAVRRAERRFNDAMAQLEALGYAIS